MPVAAQGERDTQAVVQLRDAYFRMDFEGGVLEGRRTLDASASTEARAWYLLNLARYRAAPEAADEARQLVEHHSEDPWAWFALAGTTYQLNDDSTEALAASHRALALAPVHPDVRYLRAEVLRTQENPDAALAFIDSVQATATPSAELLVVKARALYDTSGDYTPSVDEARIDSAYATFAHARALDSMNVQAYFYPAELHQRKRRIEEAVSLLERAAALSPQSADVHLAYGHAILARTDLTDDEKRALIIEDVERMLRERGDTPELLFKAADLYRDVEDFEMQHQMEERLLAVEPHGARAEWTHLIRIRQYRQEHADELYGEGVDPDVKAEYRSMLRAFTERSWHVDEGLLGEAYLNLFLAADSSISTDELEKVVEGMVQYERLNPQLTYPRGATALAERGLFRRAEQIALAGLEPMRARVEDRRPYESEEAYANSLGVAEALIYDALGWTYFLEGQLGEAEKHLSRAYDLSEGQSIDALYHLGRLYEARYDRAQATEGQPDRAALAVDLDHEALFRTAFQYYQEGTRLQTPGTNRNEAALKALYRKHRGSLDGFEAFLASLMENDQVARKREVLAERLEASRRVEPFTLEQLDGGTLSSEDLAGNVAVVNVWSTTCGPCLWEMPDLQVLYERYRDDPEVLVLTINTDFNPDDARQWLDEKGLSLPVLLDDGYLDRMHVRAYPTTWFIDREGRIAFEKVGWSKHLIEEFSWRIEALR